MSAGHLPATGSAIFRLESFYFTPKTKIECVSYDSSLMMTFFLECAIMGFEYGNDIEMVRNRI